MHPLVTTPPDIPTAITQPELWMNLTQGLLGSAIALIGVFIAFWLTRGHDREMQRQGNRLQIQEQQRALCAAHTVTLTRMSLSFRDKRIKDQEEHISALTSELMVLGVAVAHFAPKVRAWAFAQHRLILKLYSDVANHRATPDKIAHDWTYRPSIELPTNFEWEPTVDQEGFDDYVRATKALSWQVGSVSGELARWATHGYDPEHQWNTSATE